MARTPLPGSGKGDRVVDALDGLDERMELRHVEQTGWLLRTIGGLAAALVAVTLVALLLVGASRGVPLGPVAEAFRVVTGTP